VPHHLLDIVEPDEDFTAAVFKRLANRAIIDISCRAKLPILAGGTGLYIDGVIYDFGFLPEGDRKARADLNALTIPQLKQKINDLRIVLDGIDTGNKRRLIRLIETNGARPTKQQLRPNTHIIGLRIDRDELNARITKRVDDMLANGLENEVKRLVKRYGWACEGLKGVGYAQWQNYFSGTQTLEETRAKIIKATQDLAKRQRTWFKRNKSIHWFSTAVDQQEIIDFVTTAMYK